MDATGLPQVSTGDMLRAAVKAETSVGLEAKKYMDAGALVPDQVIIDLIKDRMKEDDAQDGVMFDGFPRTVPQAEALAEIVDVSIVLAIDVPDERIVERICGRFSCGTVVSSITMHSIRFQNLVVHVERFPRSAVQTILKRQLLLD